MGDIFSPDFQDLLKVFNLHSVGYILVGGYAVNYYGYNRTTADMDLYVEVSDENYSKISKAFQHFGLPVFDMTIKNFLNTEKYDVFVFGRAPVRIDIITKIIGLPFQQAWRMSQVREIDSIQIRILTRAGLIEAKKIAGRFKDLEDIKQLELIAQEE